MPQKILSFDNTQHNYCIIFNIALFMIHEEDEFIFILVASILRSMHIVYFILEYYIYMYIALRIFRFVFVESSVLLCAIKLHEKGKH